MHAVWNCQLLTFRCPGTSSDSSPAVCRIRFSIASLQYRLLSFCYVTDDTESRSQWQCSAKHDGTTRTHPDNWKMKVKKIFRRFAQRDQHYAPLYTVFGSGHITPKYLVPALILAIMAETNNYSKPTSISHVPLPEFEVVTRWKRPPSLGSGRCASG